jgi:hypothetical protein
MCMRARVRVCLFVCVRVRVRHFEPLTQILMRDIPSSD